MGNTWGIVIVSGIVLLLVIIPLIIKALPRKKSLEEIAEQERRKAQKSAKRSTHRHLAPGEVGEHVIDSRKLKRKG